jgi:mannitol-1-phosphate 5-dehydrogenase
MKKAVQFGAGNIGRGFMGQLFYEAGYATVFVEADKKLVKALHEKQEYPLKLLDAYSKKEIEMTIGSIDAVHVDEQEEIADHIAKADVMATAVGVKNLPNIAALIAGGIEKRAQQKGAPVDIYLCENLLDAADQLKKAVYEELSEDLRGWAEKNVGFVGTTVARMVPVIDPEVKKKQPLLVVADSYHSLPYDGKANKTDPPPIEGLHPVSNFRAEVERKLFVYNLGHAALAYLGNLKHYTYVHQTVKDDYFFSIFSEALDESSEALFSLYPHDLEREHHNALRKDIDIRYGNPLIRDTVERVGRDPIRKLRPGDRIVGSLHLCLEQGVEPKRICSICAAALCYDNPKDSEAVRLQKMIEEQGVEATLEEITGIEPTSESGEKILDAYKVFQRSFKQWRM